MPVLLMGRSYWPSAGRLWQPWQAASLDSTCPSGMGLRPAGAWQVTHAGSRASEWEISGGRAASALWLSWQLRHLPPA